jgi:hypothetical protein
MVLDDKATAFLLQVRQAMAASNGSPVEAESIPLEEVAAAVEASGSGFSQRDGCGHSFQLREYISLLL